MPSTEFTPEQIQAINELNAALKKCREADVHIAGVSEFIVAEQTDANGMKYVGIH
ncbi:MAG: hypothetical protein JWR09_3463 [Mucilaginibacter sp.]|nr:hypothetical protein [Mucilaginibacter sp.]